MLCIFCILPYNNNNNNNSNNSRIHNNRKLFIEESFISADELF